MAHGIYNTKAQANKVLRELVKANYHKGKLKVVARYLVVDKK